MFSVNIPISKEYYSKSLFSRAIMITIVIYLMSVFFTISFIQPIKQDNPYHFYMNPIVSPSFVILINGIMNSQPVQLSTLSPQISNNIVSPIIKQTKNDDKIIISIEMFDTTGKGLTDLDILIELGYELKGVVNMKMKGILQYIIHQSSGIKSAYIYSNIAFQQSTPIISNKKTKTLYDTPILSLSSNTNLQNTLKSYNARNETIYAEYTSIVSSGASKGKIYIQLEIDTQILQKVFYTPKSTERIIKMCVQFVAFMIPVFYIVDWILLVLFRHNMVKHNHRLSNNFGKQSTS